MWRLALLLCFHTSLFAQSEPDYRLAFYNLENLFHPSDDPEKNDEEFTPEGARYWTNFRYYEKLNRMAKAIVAVGEWEAPALVGLAELENAQVLQDLIRTTPLQKIAYQYVHYESPDRRGVDVALIYRKDQMKLLYSEAITVGDTGTLQFRTRDILYASFELTTGDTIHTYINHWPSRYGGQAISEPRRILAARRLRNHLDSLRIQLKDPAVIIMGDFNDEPENQSLSHFLVQKNTPDSLVNLMADRPPNEGSHRYKGVWGFLDQIIVTPSLMDEQGLDVVDQEARVCRADFLLEQDEKYPGVKPFRSFLGMRYHGGFSDHLPVYIDLTANPK